MPCRLEQRQTSHGFQLTAATSGSSNTDSCRRDMVLLSTETRPFTKDITDLTHSDRVSTSTSSFLAQRRAYSSTESKINLELCFQIKDLDSLYLGPLERILIHHNPIRLTITNYLLKRKATFVADDILILSEKMSFDIACESSAKHEMSRLVFLQQFKKLKLSSATAVICALRVN